jgi:hypothetical protein
MVDPVDLVISSSGAILGRSVYTYCQQVRLA